MLFLKLKLCDNPRDPLVRPLEMHCSGTRRSSPLDGFKSLQPLRFKYGGQIMVFIVTLL